MPPNASKLSDRGWPRKSRQREKTRWPASVRWSAWLGSPPTEGPLDRRNDRQQLRRGNDGRCRRGWMSGADSLPEGRTDRGNNPSGNRRVLARTRNQRATGNGGNGNQRALEEPHAGDSRPNELKLSDRGWRNKGEKAEKTPLASLCSLERVVRPPAYRGPLDRRNGRRGLRRGNEGAAAGDG